MLRALSVIVICGTTMMGSSQSNPPNEARSSSPATVVPQHQTPTKSTAIIGLGGVKEKTAGTLNVKDGKLCFVHSGNKSQIPAAAIADVVTSEDSQRVIRGTLGTLSMFAPYKNQDALLSVVRSKIDILTIQYRDDDGGLHGVIFTMPVGVAEPIKQELITQGAHTTILKQPRSRQKGSNDQLLQNHHMLMLVCRDVACWSSLACSAQGHREDKSLGAQSRDDPIWPNSGAGCISGRDL